MALIPSATYPGQIDTSDSTGYPQGKAQNIVVPGDGVGTPWEKDLVNDLFGFEQALLGEAEITPSGTPDTATASDYVDAIKRLMDARGALNWRGPGVLGTDQQTRGGSYDSQNRVWVVVGNTDLAALSYNDGQSWRDWSTGMGTLIGLEDVAVSPAGAAIAVGNSATVYRRANLVIGSWTTASLPGSPAPNSVSSVEYSTSHGGFVCVSGTASATPYIATSDVDGSTWTERSTPAGFAALRLGGLAVNQSGAALAAAQTAHTKIAVSADGGTTWVDSTTDLPSKIWHLGYNSTRDEFMAVATDGVCYVSADGGANWTAKQTIGLSFDSVGGVSTGYHGVTAYGHMWLVIGERTNSGAGAIAFSTDGGDSWGSLTVLPDNPQAIWSDWSGNVAMAGSLNGGTGFYNTMSTARRAEF